MRAVSKPDHRCCDEEIRTSSKCDVGSRVHSQAIVLVVYSGSANSNTSTATHVKSISIVPTTRVAVLVVDRDGTQGQVSRSIDAKNLDWRVLDVDAGDGG